MLEIPVNCCLGAPWLIVMLGPLVDCHVEAFQLIVLCGPWLICVGAPGVVLETPSLIVVLEPLVD